MNIDELTKTFAENEHRKRTAVCNQELVKNIDGLADALMAAGKVVGCPAGSKLYAEGSRTRGVFFILDGKVEISRDGNLLAIIEAKNQVGSWPSLTSSPKYDVTVTAIEDAVLLHIEEEQFRVTADRFPEMWKRLALSQADRLKTMNALFLPVNDIPKLFIGSSTKSLQIAEVLAGTIKEKSRIPIEVHLWSEAFNRPGESYLEVLAAGLDEWDFAAFLLAPDDEIVSGQVTEPIPRDNLIFEAGLSTGRLGRKRTFLIERREPQKEKQLSLPSDLDGIVRLFYDENVTEVLERLMRRIVDSGPRTRLAIHKFDK